MMIDKVELLAPAGSMDKLKLAFLYGADAVYLGGKNYSLRANATNFSKEEIKEACLYAHELGKKVYVAVNIVFHEEDMEGIEEYLRYLAKVKVDAVIVSDIAIMELINKKHIHLDIHVSTQASVLNDETALFYKSLGAKRIVLAREASREDIIKIKKKTCLELEVFIHGAMCTSFSGRCVMSNYCTNRDANRGGCAQICRWTFDYKKDNKIISDFPFSMTPKDLCMASLLEDMLSNGVNSFKIEGRMRSIYYIATVILIYRRLIDKIRDCTLDNEYFTYAMHILNRVANRDSAPQFYGGMPGMNEQYYLGREEVSNQDFKGLVLDYDEENNLATIEERNYFKVGDEVSCFGPKHETITFKIKEMYNEDNEQIEVASHPKMIVKIRLDYKVDKYDMLRIKVIDEK